MCSQHTSFVSAANLSQVHVWFSIFFLTCVAVSGIERIGPVTQSELVNSLLGNMRMF